MSLFGVFAPIVSVCFLFSCGGEGSPAAQVFFNGPSRFPTSPELSGGAKSYAAFSITVTSKTDIAPGGGIGLEQGRFFRGRPLVGADVRYAFPDPVLGNGPLADRLTARTKKGPFKLTLRDAGLGRRSPRIIFPEGLPAGEGAVFCFGDRESGGPGLSVPAIPMKISFLSFIDLEGNGNYRLAEADHPLVETFVSGADRFRVVAPSLVKEGKVKVRILPVRGAGGGVASSFPVSDYTGGVAVFTRGSKASPSVKVIFKPGDGYKDAEVFLDTPGLVRLSAVSDDGALSGESNPIMVTGGPGRPGPGADFILWGSLQNHTAVGGHALSVPTEAFEAARGIGCLDFCAVTDHSSNPSFHWEELRNLPDRYDSPGEFVAFPGYEWTSDVHGHRHVILKDGTGTKALTEKPADGPAEACAPALADLDRLIGSDPNVLIAVHHTMLRYDPPVGDYDFGAPGAIERQLLFEVFSWHGSSEFNGGPYPMNGSLSKNRRPGSSFRDALAAGHCFAVTGDSDGHAGLPGVPVAVKRKSGMRYGLSGLTAVYASSFDRGGVFKALEKGRCYGTTGARILIFLTMGGAGPGGEAEASEPLEVEAEIHGTAALSSVQIVRDGSTVVFDEKPGALDWTRSFVLPGEPRGGDHSYYLRVEQADGHQAWVTPVRIGRPSAQKQDGDR